MIQIRNNSKTLKLFSYTNQVSNGNFVDAIGWTGSGSVLSVSSNIATITGNGTQTIPRIFQNTSLAIVVGHILYISAILKVTNAVAQSIFTAFLGSGGGAAVTVGSQLTPTDGTEYLLTGVGTVPAASAGNVTLRLVHQYADAATSNNKVMTARQIFMIDLTTMFGAGNEPTATDCANIFKFIDGTKQPNFSNTLMV